MSFRRVREEQSGFTLIEVMVAALIVVIGLTGVGLALVRGQNESSSDVRESQLMNVADQQIEQIRAEVQANGFSELAMSATPQSVNSGATWTSTVQGTWANPDKFAEASSGCGTANDAYEIASNYDSVSTGSAASAPYGSAPYGFTAWSGCPSDGEPLEVITPASGAPVLVTTGTTTNPPECGLSASAASSSATIVSPCTMSLNNGTANATATVYTFVTDTYAPCAAAAGAASCPSVSSTGTVTSCTASSFPTTSLVSSPCSDARRVTVAVVPSGSSSRGRITPVYLSTLFTNPQPSSQQTNSLGLTLGVGL